MSLFNKVLSSVGIGSATVDTKLENDTFMPGSTIKGVVEIRGGNVEQKVDEISLSLHTTYQKESNDRKYSVNACIAKVRVTESFTIGPNQKSEIPFSFQLPEDMPISIGKTKIWVNTGLDIKNAVDPSDKDFIRVLPTVLMEGVMEAIFENGFRIREVDCEEASHRIRRRHPFVQEFEFIPTSSGPFRGRLDEIEVIFFPSGNENYEVLMQVDRRARGLGSFLAEALEMDESFVRFTVTNEEIPYLTQKIYTILQNHC